MRIEWRIGCAFPDDVLETNRRYAASLGLPDVSVCRGASHSLAVVGGGPSIKDHVEELRAWPGEVWAINDAFVWCRQNGIDATFYTVDSSASLAGVCKDADQAVLVTQCAPELFDALKGARIEVADLNVLPSYATSAGTAPGIALARGHREVTFFGCESSYVTTTHLYKHDASKYPVKVIANGQEFLSEPTLVAQAEFLSDLIRSTPDVFKERSGGLLSALVSSPGVDVIAASPEVHRLLEMA